ncbi:hypothetical protein [Aureibacter tunicatorum]|uniref:Lipocalin-like domain-containing protein n=1 Tax=Aureibacter tunicatorum TaxID=866807 RepID=A0AAE3XMD1_9BACT|nr:hypothetical protein [Aureibacter tunicatorum]MDR6238643.1 hypothetical protein [Aureibacter tunicatorum]BDD05426.1 hypothetical protein AUTU_29090 [Aureibacter tunicatorum]
MKKLAILALAAMSFASCSNNENVKPKNDDIKVIQSNMWKVQAEDKEIGLSLETTVNFPTDCPQVLFYASVDSVEPYNNRPPLPLLAANCVLSEGGFIHIGDTRTSFKLNEKKTQLTIGEAVLTKTMKFETTVKNPMENAKDKNWEQIVGKSWTVVASHDKEKENCVMTFSKSKALVIIQAPNFDFLGITPLISGFKFNTKGEFVFTNDEMPNFKLVKYTPSKVELSTSDGTGKMVLTPIKL